MAKSKKTNRNEEDLLVNNLHKAKAILKNINWDFSLKSTFSPHEMRPFNCRKYHWSHATFVPEIPFTLIEVLTLPGAVVYDPFAGIGTTYFQSLLLCRNPLVTENSSVFIEFIRSLLLLFNPHVNLSVIKMQVKRIVDDYNPNINYITRVYEDTSIQNFLIEELEPWYHRETFNQLAYLFLEEYYCEDPLTKSVLRISISNKLRGLSSQDGGGSYIADNVKPKPEQIREKTALKRCLQEMNLLIEDISDHIKNTDVTYIESYDNIMSKQTVYQADIRENVGIPDGYVDLIVTSPPYPNMTDYVKSQRLSYYWIGATSLDVDLSKDFNREIGARNKRLRKYALAHYIEDMKKTNEIISKKMKVGGYACYVMPVFGVDNDNNNKRRKVIETVLLDLQQLDFKLEETFERIIPPRRYHALWATLEREKIYLFRKE
jgi:hypothetical protein